jgi:thiosulfate/3-mercaptopyruvate sulfurtransferase
MKPRIAHPLISVEQLRGWLDSAERRPILLDCRFDLARPEAGREAWAAAHLPGARHADLDRELSDLAKPAALGRHPLPEREAFHAAMARWGVAADTAVVVYDHGPGALAARLWWLLRSVGHRQVQLLDGGLQAWKAAGAPLSSAADASEADEASPGLSSSLAAAGAPVTAAWPGWLDNEALSVGLASGQWCLIDAREAARYRGEIEPIDPIAGHIPGALNRPFSANLDANGCFKPPGQLGEEFVELLGDYARSPERVVHQCGSGVTACHNLLAMEVAGLQGSLLHAPSWSGWIAEGREVASGPGPGNE